MEPEPVLIAPCGINCSLCLGYLRKKDRCEGCRTAHKKYHETCRIKNCEHLAATASGFCYECSRYPCQRLRNLEKRYRLRYNVFIYRNFEVIRTEGARALFSQQAEEYRCPGCGGTICMHRGFCLDCEDKRKKNQNRKAIKQSLFL